MSAKMRFTMTFGVVLFVFLLSAVMTVPALADDAAPPPDAPITDGTDAVTIPTEESPSPPVEEAPVAEELLPALPEETEVVVLDEGGEPVPLVTEDAAQIILEGDPMWCPAGVSPGGVGCTINHPTFAALLADAIFAGGGPAMDGVIWIRDNYAGADAAAITINGGTLTTMNDYALTLQGGWTGVGATINTLTPSVFDVRLNIIDWNNNVTVNDITISGATGGNALNITTTKNIALTRVTVQSNSSGASLNNTINSGTGNVTVNNGIFSLNSATGGLLVQSNGTITLTNVTASNNTGYGANLINSGAASAKNVTITNGTFNSNTAGGTGGLIVTSNGAIALTNVTASSNTNYGANLNNSGAPTVQKVTVTGGTFNTNGAGGLQVMSLGNITLSTVAANGNTGQGASVDNRVGGLGTGSTVITNGQFNTNAATGGLLVLSNGTITLNSIKANGNTGGYGASIDNSAAASAKNVTLSGVNEFNDNRSNGLVVTSKGAISASDITANANGILNTSGSGAVLDNTSGANPGPGVTLTGTNIFTDNYTNGLTVNSNGPVKLNSVIANANGTTFGYGLWIVNNTASTAQPVTLTGTSQFKYNHSSGLLVFSQGAITLNNITANNNTSGSGVHLENDNSFTAGVTLTGVNNFTYNWLHGLYVQSLGAISVSNVTADNNGQSGTVGYGASLDNSSALAFQKVTVSGVNSFNNNRWTGLLISSKGAVSISSVTANNAQTGYGVYLSNIAGGNTNSKQPVSLGGTNMINNNHGYGLYIESYGAVTLNNVTASENGLVATNGYGVFVSNQSADTPMAVTINGINTFNGNYMHGLLVNSKGAIKASNLTAEQNGLLGSFGSGVELNNTFGGAAGTSLTLTGANFFNDNYNSGLGASSSGAISLNNITATNSAHGYGLYVNNQSPETFASPKDVNITGTNVFNGNYYDGVAVLSYGNIVTNNLTAIGNGTSTISGSGADLANNGAPAPRVITLKGTNVFSDNYLLGLNVHSIGTITVNNITATGNQGSGGAWLQNEYPGAVGGVNLTGVNFFDLNVQRGLTVYTYGAITASNLNASANQMQGGVQLNNHNSATAQKVTLTGTNSFDGNLGYGLEIRSTGAISLNSISAIGNLGTYGATINNTFSPDTAAQAVTLTGTNVFNENWWSGLYVTSYGAISLAGTTANDNGQSGPGAGSGAYLSNYTSDAPQKVALSGVNTFNGNSDYGLFVETKGAITSATSLTANENGGNQGAFLSNNVAGGVGGITLAGTNTMQGNLYTGLVAYSFGPISINNVTASGNGASGTSGYGADLNNGGSTTPMNVTLTGTNSFNDNYSNGLTIATKGAILANNLTASANTNGAGVAIDNFNGSSDSATSPGVTFTGKNFFEDNLYNGLAIMSHGAITLNNVSANGNGNAGFGSGVNLYNPNLVAPKNITINGTNTFNDNSAHGLFVSDSTGSITINNVTATDNDTGSGAYLSNASGTLGVTLTGTNKFNQNALAGLTIQTNGSVSMTKVTADGNLDDGLYVIASGNVTLTCGSITGNGDWGVNIFTPSLKLIGVVSSGNSTGNVNTGGVSTLVTVRTCPLP